MFACCVSFFLQEKTKTTTSLGGLRNVKREMSMDWRRDGEEDEREEWRKLLKITMLES